MTRTGNHLGHEYQDAYGSGSFFVVEEIVDGAVVRTETGTNSHTHDGMTEESSFTYKFDADWNLIKGEETRNGVTIEYGANWEILGQSVSFTGLTPLGSGDLVGIPAALQAPSGQATYATVTNFGPNDSQTQFFDATGTILGYMDTWSDGQGGENKTFMDGQWNFLGSSGSDRFGSHSRVEVEKVDDASGTVTGTANAKYYEETEVNTHFVLGDDGEPTTETETFTRVTIYDENWNQISATETRPDGQTVEFG